MTSRYSRCQPARTLAAQSLASPASGWPAHSPTAGRNNPTPVGDRVGEPGLGHQITESMQIYLVTIDRQRVPARAAHHVHSIESTVGARIQAPSQMRDV